ncbi:hypothetical protein ACJMK2_027163 [Sinanodonta woodiana]|uniref:Cytochrome c oxidase subunit 7C, mitochondrial n=1 Tax=Sinanodonta woodiana TaxID=1069815 RepID=A0ABD3XLT5_SINWO
MNLSDTVRVSEDRLEWRKLVVGSSNLPIDISNRYKLTAIFTIFMCSSFSLPFIVVRHQLLKKNM